MTSGKAALDSQRRVRDGWQVRRDGCGFLSWFKPEGNQWEVMTEAEAEVWWSERDRASDRTERNR